MKSKLLAACLLTLSFVVSLSAEDIAKHKARMDAAQELKDDLRDALDAKNQGKALGLAQKLVKSGQAEERYWQNAKIAAVVALAGQNLSASRKIAAAIKSADYAGANRAFADLETTCRSCHDLHPEKQIAVSKPAHF